MMLRLSLSLSLLFICKVKLQIFNIRTFPIFRLHFTIAYTTHDTTYDHTIAYRPHLY